MIDKLQHVLSGSDLPFIVAVYLFGSLLHTLHPGDVDVLIVIGNNWRRNERATRMSIAKCLVQVNSVTSLNAHLVVLTVSEVNELRLLSRIKSRVLWKATIESKNSQQLTQK